MAELNTQVNIKEKIYAVRSVVPNKSNNEIVLVLQQFDNNVDRAVQAFMDGSAIQVLKEWNMTGKKKNNKRKRSKSKQHQGNKDAKDKVDKAEAASLVPPGMYNCHVNGCDKDNSSTESTHDKTERLPREKKPLALEEPLQAQPEVTGSRLPRQRLSLDANPKPVPGIERSDGLQASAQPQYCNTSRPKSKPSVVKSCTPATHPEVAADEVLKKRGPNIEKSVKDLQRCTVSLTRYRVMIKEEVDNSVKKIKAAFAELHSCIIDKEVSLMAEMDKVKEEAMEILTARQKKAEELKRLTDLSSQMAEAQLAELRAEIKHFVSERKYDEELGRSAKFSCDIEQLKTQIMLCGEISHPKNNYSSRTPCSSLLPVLNAHTATSGKQNNYNRKPPSHKTSDNKAAVTKMPSNPPNANETSPQVIPATKQNGPSSQRRRFNPQYHNNRLNGPAKSQGNLSEADYPIKGNPRHDHRRQQHNSFRPKNKGITKNQEPPLATKASENPAHSEKPRRKQHAVDAPDARPFRGSVARVTQCNLCPTRIEVSADAAVLSVPAVTLVA
ncbi:SPATS2-like protein isoform X2 [Monodelphis domestica]|uniref:SPATS2-like protein isoform X2 n=1 Tax=Monodelphis domestica TaxID=13616 RepID=UPI0024E1D5BE|nr:SPATS2-like protein isoform X2 [Monodelphis domestica]